MAKEISVFSELKAIVRGDLKLWFGNRWFAGRCC